MTATTLHNWDSGATLHERLGAAREGFLRLAGAALHILATVAVARSLSPEETGVYYRGAVIAFGLAFLLKNKFEFYGAPYIASNRARSFGISVPRLIAGLSRRMLIRAAVICGILLVVTADLDILELRYRPFLQTNLPFVLSIPALALSTMLSSFLRASKRPALSVISSTFSVNVVLLSLAAFGGAYKTLELFSWAFLVGNLLAAGLACFVTWEQFRDRSYAATLPQRGPAHAALWADVHADVALKAGAARAHATLIWGPVCLLAVIVPPAEFALFAVAARTAQAMDLVLPSLNLLACNETAILPSLFGKPGGRSRRVAAVLVAALVSSLVFAGFIFGLPAILALFGSPYAEAASLFVLLLCAQWLNGVGRAALRFYITHWEIHHGRWILEISSLAAILITAGGVMRYGVMAGAIGILAGAVIVNTLITVRMLLERAEPAAA